MRSGHRKSTAYRRTIGCTGDLGAVGSEFTRYSSVPVIRGVFGHSIIGDTDANVWIRSIARRHRHQPHRQRKGVPSTQCRRKSSAHGWILNRTRLFHDSAPRIGWRVLVSLYGGPYQGSGAYIDESAGVLGYPVYAPDPLIPNRTSLKVLIS